MMTQSKLRSKWVVIFAGTLICLSVFVSIPNKKASCHPSNLYQPPGLARIGESIPEGIVKQKFSYLAQGAQSCAFESEDGKYVMKFFPLRYPNKEKINHVSIFNAYQLAYDEFREESGLVFLHLLPTSNLNRRVEIKDKWGVRYRVDLDKTAFVIQEKAELIFDRFKKLKKAGDFRGVQEGVEAILQLVKARISKNLTDDDKAVTHNYGFVGKKAIQLDIGRLHRGIRENEYELILEKIEKKVDLM